LSSQIYLDYAATAPIDAAAIDAMTDAARAWANPSSVHAAGRLARAALEAARAEVARALGTDRTVLFTSSGTEALHIALGRARTASHMASAIEHRAVLSAVPDARIVTVDARGLIDLTALEGAVGHAPGPELIAVMHANNETGVVQPIDEVARIARVASALLLVDAVQSAGKLPLPDADFIAVSAHKLGGPPGVGALIVRDLGLLAANGGGQERGYRAGTENLPAIAGFAAALGARASDANSTARVAALRSRLEKSLCAAGGLIAGDGAERLPNITCVAMPGVEAIRQLMLFDLEGFAVSAGAACSSGTVKASHVLTAMGWGAAASEAIRVSLGWRTTEAEVDAFAAAWQRVAARLGRRAAA